MFPAHLACSSSQSGLQSQHHPTLPLPVTHSFSYNWTFPCAVPSTGSTAHPPTPPLPPPILTKVCLIPHIWLRHPSFHKDFTGRCSCSTGHTYPSHSAWWQGLSPCISTTTPPLDCELFQRAEMGSPALSKKEPSPEERLKC